MNLNIDTYFSISSAATFLFSYNLSFRARTMFGVKGEKSFSVFMFFTTVSLYR